MFGPSKCGTARLLALALARGGYFSTRSVWHFVPDSSQVIHPQHHLSQDAGTDGNLRSHGIISSPPKLSDAGIKTFAMNPKISKLTLVEIPSMEGAAT